MAGTAQDDEGEHRRHAPSGGDGQRHHSRAVIAAFVVLKGNVQPSPALEVELRQTVRQALGPVAVVGDLIFVPMLPKTRSGKIMRRVLKAVLVGQEVGDVSTIEDETSVAEVAQAWRRLGAMRGT
ncbi:MAG: hypothetical protein IMW86_00620 [Hydrogenibacillus sp.]|nr:hypothetical protein [Hydrogenibacillus sp.]